MVFPPILTWRRQTPLKTPWWRLSAPLSAEGFYQGLLDSSEVCRRHRLLVLASSEGELGGRRAAILPLPTQCGAHRTAVLCGGGNGGCRRDSVRLGTGRSD